jgi:hypothetical protein
VPGETSGLHIEQKEFFRTESDQYPRRRNRQGTQAPGWPGNNTVNDGANVHRRNAAVFFKEKGWAVDKGKPALRTGNGLKGEAHGGSFYKDC